MGQPRQALRVRTGETDGGHHKTRRLVRESRETPGRRGALMQVIGGPRQERLSAVLALLLTEQALGGRSGGGTVWAVPGTGQHVARIKAT